MKKTLTLFVGVMLMFSSYTKADEGMWLLNMLNKSYEDMKKQGIGIYAETQKKYWGIGRWWGVEKGRH